MTKTFTPQERGSLFIIVMWWLFLLAALGVALFGYVSSRIDVAREIRDRTIGRYAAAAGVYYAMAVLAEDETSGYDALSESWGTSPSFQDHAVGENATFNIRYETGELDEDGEPVYHYGMIDEERKININKASDEVLTNLMQVIGGTDKASAEALAASIVDWRDTDDDTNSFGAESSYYQRLMPPYPCANGPFRSLNELMLVKGMSQALFDRLKSHITIYGSGAVNINTTDANALECLGINATAARDIIRFRNGHDGKPGSGDDIVFETTGGISELLDEIGTTGTDRQSVNRALALGLITVRSDNFGGHIGASLDNSTEIMQITFVFNRNGLIRFWREQ
jgi:type II secretory pathway component PulK